MLVYGDRADMLDGRDALEAIGEGWRIALQHGGLDRHARLVTAFVEAGRLAQGLADQEVEGSGCEGRHPASQAAMALLVAMARAIVCSWDSDFLAPPAPLGSRFAALRAALPQGRVEARRPEGHAFYALYPEAYAEAARPPGPTGTTTHVIGLRSIGAGLAAMVAARLGSALPATLRPRGNPFRREVRPGPSLAAEWLADPASCFAIVDEGPGLSGSSFGAVCDWLDGHGVAPERIILFPGHPHPPGREASPRHARLWMDGRVRRPCVTVDTLILHAARPARRLATWVAGITGGAERGADLSGGTWRSAMRLPEARWPASDTMQERRKLVFQSPGGPVLARFAGLGADGPAKLARARRLHASGCCPEPLGLVHGFLVERWYANARPLGPADARHPGLLTLLPRYLGLRAQVFPENRESGASLGQLATMAARNGGLALGAEAARRLAALEARAPDLEPQVRRVSTDNRLDLHEWIALEDGRILKTDALDHAYAHDLVGCQDPAWDVAGACVELGMDGEEREGLRRAVETTAGRPVSPALVAFCLPCYAAFRLGAFTLAAGSHAGSPEAARLQARADAYARVLAAEIAG